MVFQGPQAYVTPSWYATKRETGKVVPTWNYATVHAWGRPRVIEDADWLRRQIADLTDLREAGAARALGGRRRAAGLHRRAAQGHRRDRDPDRADRREVEGQPEPAGGRPRRRGRGLSRRGRRGRHGRGHGGPGAGTERTMSARENDFGQPIGPALPDWRPRPLPPRDGDAGARPAGSSRSMRSAMRPTCSPPSRRPPTGGAGPISAAPCRRREGAYRAELAAMAAGADPLFHAILDGQSGRALGLASYLRIDPANGVIEVGHLHFSPRPGAAPAAHRGDGPDDGPRLRRARLPPLRVEVRQPSTRPRARRPCATASPSRASSATPSWSRAAPATPPGSRSPTPSGRGCAAAFRAWLAPENFFEDGRQRRTLADLRTG